jgi:hypothetical protein
VDSVLDPFVVTDAQRFTAEELRRLPVTTVEEAVALSAGAVGESYRGGRIGEQAFIVDGLGIKNQLDASTSTTTLGLPPTCWRKRHSSPTASRHATGRPSRRW